MEIWKSLDERYSVSSLGRVKSNFKNQENILKPCLTYKGYEMVTLMQGKKRNSQLVHRLVAAKFLDLKEGQVVNHKDYDKTNNMLYNLEACSQSHNRQHDFKDQKRFVSKYSKTNTFKVMIRHEGKQNFFGYFKSSEEAYEVAYQSYFKLFNKYPWSK